MKVTFKTDGYDKMVICNGAETKLLISKSSYGSYVVYHNEEKLKEVYYLEDAKELVKKLLELGIGRDYAKER